MNISAETIIFILLLIDSVGINLVAWFGEGWYNKNFRTFSRFFPAAKGWAAYYLLLVLAFGYFLFIIERF